MGLRCWEGKCLKCNCWLLIRLPGESLAMDLHCVRQNGFWRGVEQLLQTGGVHETSVRTETLLGIEEFIGVWVVAVWSEGHRNTEGLSSSTSQPACHITTLALVSPGLSQQSELSLAGQSQTSTAPAWGSASQAAHKVKSTEACERGTSCPAGGKANTAPAKWRKQPWLWSVQLWASGPICFKNSIASLVLCLLSRNVSTSGRSWSCAKLHLFIWGSSSLCIGIYRPRVWCLPGTLQPQCDAVLCVRNEKVRVYQRLLNSGTGWSSASPLLGELQVCWLLWVFCESCLLRRASRRGLSAGNLFLFSQG